MHELWIDFPDSEANNVGLNLNHITTGSGGFLISSMNIMIEDAHDFYSADLTKQYKEIEKVC